jgi:acyl dehydratase
VIEVELGAGGPYFDELEVGQVFDAAPSITFTEGRAAAHQAIVGDRLRLALDTTLSERVLRGGALAHPALVWNTAIGQSTLATRNVKANLFYRGLAFHRAPVIGDTLHTTTTVVALRQNAAKPGRAATGMAGLRIVSVDQHDRLVLDFHRCAMIPLAHQSAQTGHNDDLAMIGEQIDASSAGGFACGWDLAEFGAPAAAPRFDQLAVGDCWTIAGGDVVSSAPELARLTLNIAAVHHDSKAAGGRRLVYGGHTIAVALSQVTRDLPSMVTVVAWHGCDHTGPVYEGDTLRSTVTIEGLQPRRDGGGLAHLRCRVSAGESDAQRAVLDWRFVALVA